MKTWRLQEIHCYMLNTQTGLKINEYFQVGIYFSFNKVFWRDPRLMLYSDCTSLCEISCLMLHSKEILPMTEVDSPFKCSSCLSKHLYWYTCNIIESSMQSFHSFVLIKLPFKRQYIWANTYWTLELII